jgi:hypothetical protein
MSLHPNGQGGETNSFDRQICAGLSLAPIDDFLRSATQEEFEGETPAEREDP